MSPTRSAFLVAILVAVSYGVVSGQQNPCEFLTKFGIYDTSEETRSFYTIEHLRTRLRETHAGTFKDFESESGGGGISYAGIGLTGEAANSHEKFGEWRDSILNSSMHDLEAKYAEGHKLQTVSKSLMDAVKHCLDSDRPGLRTWLQPNADGMHFTLHMKYLSFKKEDATLTTDVDFFPPESVKAVSQEARQLMLKGATVGKEEKTLSFERRSADAVLTVTVHTDQGDRDITIPSFGPEKSPPTNDLERRLAALERQLVELKAAQSGTLLAASYSTARDESPRAIDIGPAAPARGNAPRSYLVMISSQLNADACWEGLCRVLLNPQGTDIAEQTEFPGALRSEAAKHRDGYPLEAQWPLFKVIEGRLCLVRYPEGQSEIRVIAGR